MTALGLMLSVWSIVEFRISAFEYTYGPTTMPPREWTIAIRYYKWSAYVKARYVGSLSDTDLPSTVWACAAINWPRSSLAALGNRAVESHSDSR